MRACEDNAKDACMQRDMHAHMHVPHVHAWHGDVTRASKTVSALGTCILASHVQGAVLPLFFYFCFVVVLGTPSPLAFALMGSIPWLLTGEIFPSHVKGLATAVCTCINCLLASSVEP